MTAPTLARLLSPAIALGLCAATFAAPALASSDDAWAAFAKDVAKACRAATGKTFTKPDVVTDPFGTETYGLAIITGKLTAGGRASMVCVYDKKTKKVELGGELGEDLLKVSVPKR